MVEPHSRLNVTRITRTNMIFTICICLKNASARNIDVLALHAGTILLNRGNLTAALVIFDEAADLLSCKTNAGGTAHLQKAITLDSLGRSDEALKIYRQLQGHRCLDVAKTV